MHQSVISVVIPAYCEEKTIGDVISSTITTMESLAMPYEIIVVDDGSTDNTRQIAATYKATVLSNGKNRGKGYTLRRGFGHARGDIVVTIDSDGSHNPKEITDLIHPLFNGVDIVAGSRFLGRAGDSTSRLNRLGNFLFNATIMVLTRRDITDSQTGFRAFKKEVLQRLDLESVGYEIDTEITVKGLKNGFVFQEKPISCEKRKYNVSKLSALSDGMKILKTILQANFAKIMPEDENRELS
jgi:glycosyltransferase involved in cell wall biosynthesis